MFYFGIPLWFSYSLTSEAFTLVLCSNVYVRSLCVSSKFCNDLILDGMFICVQGGLHRFLMHHALILKHQTRKKTVYGDYWVIHLIILYHLDMLQMLWEWCLLHSFGWHTGLLFSSIAGTWASIGYVRGERIAKSL